MQNPCRQVFGESVPWSSVRVERGFGYVCLPEGACGTKIMRFEESLNLIVQSRAIFLD